MNTRFPTTFRSQIMFFTQHCFALEYNICDTISQNSLLQARVLSTKNLLGSDLEITAKEGNGVVQVIEDRRNKILGVQFHPELMPYKKFCRNIFKWLIKNAVSHRVQKQPLN